MTVSVVNLDDMIRGYLITTLQGVYPTLDISKQSIFDDLFIKPLIEVFKPIVTKMNDIELKMNLNNASYMTDDQLDEVAEGNYLMTRKTGNAATATLTNCFSNIAEGDSIIIPAGTIFENTKGYQYQLKDRVIYTASQLPTVYNPVTLTYNINIDVEALEAGTSYNTDADTITKCITPFSNNLISVTNKSSVTDGIDKEENAEFADRIKAYYVSRQLGTKPGYVNFISENFPEVEDMFVVGYKDSYMTRDIICDPGTILANVTANATNSTTVYVDNVTKLSAGQQIVFYKTAPATVSSVYTIQSIDIPTKKLTMSESVTVTTSNFIPDRIHIGGKVDIYLKGCIYAEKTTQVTINSNNMVLSKIYDNINFSTLNISNITDTSKNTAIMASYTKVSFVDTDNTNKCRITFDNTANKSFDPTIVSTISITYDWTDTTVEPNVVKNQIDTFEIGVISSYLDSPVKDIVSIIDPRTNEAISFTGGKTYTLSKTGISNTSSEVSSIILSGMDSMPNGINVSVNYMVNSTINNLINIFDDDKFRVITTDILCIESQPALVNIAFSTKLMDGVTFDQVLQSKIQNSINTFFSAYKLGEDVNESDLVAWLYKDSNISGSIQYISLGLTSFYVAANVSDSLEIGRRDGTALSINRIAYPILNKLQITPIS